MDKEIKINFDNFIETFYNNNNGLKMVLEINLDSNEDTTLHDIHFMLLQLLFAGLTKYHVSYDTIQQYFDNIKIKVNITKFTVKQLIDDTNNYGNRYIRIDENINMIKNGSHNESTINNLEDIKSFYVDCDKNSLCIYFEHATINT